MPYKRVIMLDAEEARLGFALRADVPEGAETPRRDYQSIYGDPNDPDLAAIRSGAVLEKLGRIEAKIVPPETKNQALLRVQGELEALWTEFQGEVSLILDYQKAYGRFWAGDTELWSNWNP